MFPQNISTVIDTFPRINKSTSSFLKNYSFALGFLTKLLNPLHLFSKVAYLFSSFHKNHSLAFCAFVKSLSNHELFIKSINFLIFSPKLLIHPLSFHKNYSFILGFQKLLNLPHSFPWNCLIILRFSQNQSIILILSTWIS